MRQAPRDRQGIPARSTHGALALLPARPAVPALPILIALLIAAAVARLLFLGREGFWVDEAYTAWLVQMPSGAMLAELARGDDAPPLFYLLEKLIANLAGTSEAALRLLPALASLAAVAFLLARARRRREPETFWAGAFAATAAYGIFYARQARSYGLILLLGILFVLWSRDVLISPSRRSALGVAVAGSILCVTHHLAGLLILTGFGLAAIQWLRGRGRSLATLGFLPPLLLGALLALISRSQLRTHAELNAWMGEFWKQQSLGLAPLFSLGIFTPGALCPIRPSVSFATLPPQLSFWSCASFILALAVLACAWLRSPRAADRSGRIPAPHLRGPGAPLPADGPRAMPASAGALSAPLIETAFLLGPLLGLAIASAVWAPAYVLGRSDAIAFPAFALLLGRGLSRLPRVAAWGAIALWTAISFAALAPTYAGTPADSAGHSLFAGWQAKGGDRRLAQLMVGRGLKPADWLIHTHLTAPSLEYYLQRAGAPHRRAYFPPSAGASPAATEVATLDSLSLYEQQALELRDRIARDMPEEGAVWILALAAERGPGAQGAALTATPNDLAYPTSLLLYYLTGLKAQPVVARYRQDWISGDRLLLRVPRDAWVPPESLPPVQVATPGAEAAGP